MSGTDAVTVPVARSTSSTCWPRNSPTHSFEPSGERAIPAGYGFAALLAGIGTAICDAAVNVPSLPMLQTSTVPAKPPAV